MTPEQKQELRKVDQDELQHFLEFVKTGKAIQSGSAEMKFSGKMTERARLILADISTGFHDNDEVRHALEEISLQKIDASTRIILPFTTDFGANIHLGKGVYINAGVAMQDQGGIYIDDGALIGHHVVLATLNHQFAEEKRHNTVPKPIHIGKNAWIGSNATILQGVTIGENAIVAAGAVVTEDVAANTIVGGVPAKFIKKIEE